jgi:molecular chaperone HscB
VNYFEVFGLPRKLGLDAAALQRRFYELARESDPDFHQAAPAAEQERVLATSALVNAAYRTLRDPLARIEYLVRLEEGRETREGDMVKPKAPPDLLAEMFEIQEALQEAREGGLDEASRSLLAGQHGKLLDRRRAQEAHLTGELSAAWDAADTAGRPRVLTTFKEGLAARAYLSTVIDDLGAALSADQETHVPHHRH